jgi:lipoprotein-anchoring transpeptidase ErfK/SrfK
MRTKTTIAFGLLLSFIVASTIGCGAGAFNRFHVAAAAVAATTQEPASADKKSDSNSNPRQNDNAAPIHFETYTIRGAKSLAALEAKYGKDALEIMLKLNRVDRRHVGNGTKVILPAEKTDLLALAPFPAELEMISSVGKMILVSRQVQAFGAYESGRLVYWGPTSTGKMASPTPTGLYFTNWRAKETRSSINSSWRLPWYFNLDNIRGVAFHQYDLPGVPASHGCVRLLEQDAQWVFNWAEQWILTSERNSIAAYGTPVLIFGDYAYGAQPPWKQLTEDARAASVTMADVEAALKKHMPTVEARIEARRSLIAATVQVDANSTR